MLSFLMRDDSRYYRCDRYYAGYTTNYFESVVWEDFSPTSLRCVQHIFWNRWPGFSQCGQIPTAEGDDVTNTADSRSFAFRDGPFRIALCAYIFRIVITAPSSVKSSSASAPYFFVQVFIRESFRYMLSSSNTSPMPISSSGK